ncbi:MAG: 50S ribosomal protein L29 [bacterium]|nr:50S ribosomal protein L29 [bacterium]
MKRNEIRELHNKSLDELGASLKEARSELVKFRLEQATKKLKNLRLVFFQRKKIARILTVIRQKGMQNA